VRRLKRTVRGDQGEVEVRAGSGGKEGTLKKKNQLNAWRPFGTAQGKKNTYTEKKSDAQCEE